MATKTINVDVLAKMFLAGAQNIEAKKDYINELNVFPVPDGDTGTNMSMTIMSAAKEVTALNKPAMKGCMSTDLGIITIDPEVIAKYAGTVAVECFGIVGMAAVNMKDGLVHLLKKESLTRGIHVNISDDNHISIDFHIIVAYGVSISAVTDNLISDVKYRVEEFSGMQVDKINVYIEGVRVID